MYLNFWNVPLLITNIVTPVLVMKMFLYYAHKTIRIIILGGVGIKWSQNYVNSHPHYVHKYLNSCNVFRRGEWGWVKRVKLSGSRRRCKWTSPSCQERYLAVSELQKNRHAFLHGLIIRSLLITKFFACVLILLLFFSLFSSHDRLPETEFRHSSNKSRPSRAFSTGRPVRILLLPQRFPWKWPQRARRLHRGLHPPHEPWVRDVPTALLPTPS